ncbi:hypothetical protein LCGC14_0495590 [marine sediment metagenome]|uniref:CheW-like domain-containing protein n=1 Tax=marine sediment metagenome TaxID=412755 RepID=A0A0F9SAF8_9ZZZZ|nr:chemotaxis protein CheW [Methylophaga sp.]HEC58200.1 chemotaxis protein CheW [Methylophaga sp.]
MSDLKQIADHENALDLYFNDMFAEPMHDIVTSQAKHVTKDDHSTAFQALLIDINGLQLAIRTEEVKAILPWPETSLEQTPDTAHNELVMGLYNYASQQLKVINTANIVLPLEHRHNLATPSFLIIIGQGNFALSCHKINTVINLLPEDIRWRKNMTSRPWLAGIAMKKNCSIVSLDGLVNLLSPINLA